MPKIDVENNQVEGLIEALPEVVRSYRRVAADVLRTARNDFKRQGIPDAAEVLTSLITDLEVGEVSIEEFVAERILLHNQDTLVVEIIPDPTANPDPRKRPS